MILPVGTITRGQLVLGARQSVKGKGFADSFLVHDGTVSGGACFITTADYGAGSSATNIGTVEDLDIDGGQSVSQFVANPLTAVTGGVGLNGYRPAVKRCHIHGFKGPGVNLETRVEQSGVGAFRNIVDNVIRENYVGIISSISDDRIQGNVVHNNSNYNLWIKTSVGNCQCSGNHFYGAPVGVLNSGGEAPIFDDNIFADAWYGYQDNGGGHYATFSGGKFQHNFKAGAQIASTECSFDNVIVLVPWSTTNFDAIGIEFTGARNSFLGGGIYCYEWPNPLDPDGETPTVSTGVKLTGDACTVKTKGHDFGSINGKAVAFNVSGYGHEIEFKFWGYAHSGDKLLKVPNVATLRGLTAVFHGNSHEDSAFAANIAAAATAGSDNGFNHYLAEQYFDVPTGWHSSNSIRLMDDATRLYFDLVPGTAYQG